MTMKTYTKAYIQSLLDKYLDGQTSLQEERQLSEYFSSQPVPTEWEDYKEMFAWFDDGMKGKYLQDNDSCHLAETTHAQAPTKHRKLVRLTLPWLAAACLAGGLIWGWWPKQHDSQSLTANTDNVCEQPAQPSQKAHAVLQTEDRQKKQSAVMPILSDKKSDAPLLAATHCPEKTTTNAEEAIAAQRQDSLLIAEAQRNVELWQTMSDSAKADHSLLMANLLETKAIFAVAKQEVAQAKQLIAAQDKKQHVSLNNIIEL
jgi:hypothetical protein